MIFTTCEWCWNDTKWEHLLQRGRLSSLLWWSLSTTGNSVVYKYKRPMFFLSRIACIWHETLRKESKGWEHIWPQDISLSIVTSKMRSCDVSLPKQVNMTWSLRYTKLKQFTYIQGKILSINRKPKIYIL